MARPASALSELLVAFRAGGGVNLIRDAVRLVMRELIETEAAGGPCTHGHTHGRTQRSPRAGPIDQGW